MKKTTKAKRKPFHKAIVPIILNSRSQDLEFIFRFLETTEIPKGHRRILRAIDQEWAALGYWKDRVAGIREGIRREEKRHAAKREKKGRVARRKKGGAA